MADNRELTFGMDFGLDDAINRLGETIDRLEQIVDRAQDVEDAAQDMGARVRAGTDAIRDGARDAGDALDDLEVLLLGEARGEGVAVAGLAFAREGAHEVHSGFTLIEGYGHGNSLPIHG